MPGCRLPGATVTTGALGPSFRRSVRRATSSLRRRTAAAVAATLLTLQDRLGTRLGVRLEAGDDDLRNLALDQPLDVVEEPSFVDARQ